MIEVRVTNRDSWADPVEFAVYLQNCLIAAGVPLVSGHVFCLKRDGILQFAGQDQGTGEDVWRWYERDEWRDPAETVQ